MPTEVVRLPVPEHLEPRNTARSLLSQVRVYFYNLWNDTADATFRSLLASVGNKDAITGNRMFDRAKAVGMIKEAANEANDSFTSGALDGDIYKHVVGLLRTEGMGLKLRRTQYKQLTRQAPAE